MKKLLLSIGLAGCALIGTAQWSITSFGEGDTVTFDATVDDVNNGTFTGSGLTASPGTGLLDSDSWQILGLSDGNTSWGGTHTSGDYAKGTSTGGIFSGGIYAFTHSTGDNAVGVQPTGGDWTPGDIILRVINNTGDTADSFSIAYDLLINNNEGRGNTFNFSYRINSGSTMAVSSFDELSGQASQGSVLWVNNAKSATFYDQFLDGDTLYMIWSGADSTGSGSRDEFALDNISVTLHGESTSGGGGGGTAWYPISTVTTTDANGEVDSLGTYCIISGIVLGVDLDGNAGYSFTLWDTVGINVFNFNDVSGYVVQEGDSLEMIGEVDQFNGLIQFVPDSIVVVATGGTIPSPTLVTTLDESTESEPVRIENMWVDANFGSNYTLTDGTNTVVMRIDSDTDIPGNIDFNIGDTLCYAEGIGGQFDPSSPYTDGYQFFPQRAADIDNSCGSIPPPVIPYYPIVDINNVDANGEPDSIGVTCFTSGVVIGVDLDGNAGLSFTMWHEEGINVFNFVDVNNYEVTEGDSLMVRGTIGFYNGLLEILPDSIEVLSSGNELPEYQTVTSLSEETESAPIRIVNAVYATGSNTWGELPINFSRNIMLLTCTGDTVIMRIDSDTDVDENWFADSTKTFTVRGTGGQFDNSAPYFDGYQIFPMTITDVDTLTNYSAPELVINEVLSDNVNGATDENGDHDDWFEIRNDGGDDVALAGLYFSNDMGDAMKYGVSNNATETVAAGGYTLVWCDNESEEGDLHTNFELDAAGAYVSITSYDGCELVDELNVPALGADESYGYYPEGTDTLVTFQFFSTTPGAMNVHDTVNSVGDIDASNQLVVFPNPASKNQMVRFNKQISFNVYSVSGQLIESRRNTIELDVARFESGAYIIQTTEGDVLRMIVQ